jgi:NAD-dependent deacetylase
MEKRNLLQVVITQNIDNLHQEAGSRNVLEFHGNSRNLVCLKCGGKYPASEKDLSYLPPRCLQCNEPLKPDFIFFGEPIPEPARSKSFDETSRSEVFILIGTTGEIMPASLIPFEAKRKGKKIIEVNTAPSNYTGEITDIFLEGRASGILPALLDSLSEQDD